MRPFQTVSRLNDEALQQEQGYYKPQPCNLSSAEIEGIAETLAEEFHYNPGSKIKDLVESLSGKLQYVPTAVLGDSDSGSIVVEGPDKFEIYVAQDTSVLRDNFTIAHELGHYVLHCNMGAKKLRATRFGKGREEQEANRFAAALLMPAKQFRSKWNEKKSVETLASIFEVSTSAVEARCESLRLR